MQSERLLFVDLMRGIAMIVMIEVHAINALMQPGQREVSWFGPVDFINGLVAPSFLFVSGFAFLLAVQHHLQALRALGQPFWKMLGRIGLIWLLGYLLHIPSFSFSAWRQGTTPEQWRQFFSIDVLQCIACGLLLILVLRLVCRKDRLFLGAVFVLGCAAVLAAARLYQVDILRVLPFPLAAYLTPIGSTRFPLLPWFGFMAAGVLIAWFFLQARAKGEADRFDQRLLLTGFGLAIAGSLLLWFLKDRLGLIVDERPDVFFFAARLGWVLILLALCSCFCRSRERLSPFIVSAGQETLMVYFIHLQILYQPVWEGKSLVTMAAQRFSFAASLLLAVGLILLMLLMGRVWHSWKKAYRRVHAIGMTGAIVGGTLLFLVR